MRPPIYYSRSLSRSFRPKPGILSFIFIQGVRFASSTRCTDECFSLPVGNNGLVSLKVTRANVSRQPEDVILYLPPGPLFQGLDISPAHGEDQPPQHTLASMLSATVVTVNYRLGKADEIACLTKERGSIASIAEQASTGTEARTDFQFPTPIHDTLVGFDWIQSTLKPTRLGVFGSHIGGSLALMLALTEAQSVHAVAALEPICDWPGLDEYCALEEATEHPTRRKRRKIKTVDGRAPLDLIPLLEAREQFFSSPERCFDAFASQVLFLRSAGREVPTVFPRYLTGPAYPVPTLKHAASATSAEQHAASDGPLWDRDVYPILDEEDGASVEFSSPSPPPRRRKALSRWPPYGLDYGLSGQTWSGSGHGIGRLQMTLPWVRLFLRNRMDHGDGGARSTVLDQQAEEMVSVMRRACFWGREKGVGEQRVTLARIGGMQEVGGWIGQVVRMDR